MYLTDSCCRTNGIFEERVLYTWEELNFNAKTRDSCYSKIVMTLHWRLRISTTKTRVDGWGFHYRKDLYTLNNLPGPHILS